MPHLNYDDTLKLFAIYIGGAHKKSLIELHDMRFVVAQNIVETYNPLRESWWGIPTSLHLDAWGMLDYADGYDIQVSNTPPKGSHNKKLYFINLGGYDKNQFTELHKNVFIVADDEIQAKLKALRQVEEWESPHRDYIHTIDSILNLNELLNADNYYLHLQENRDAKPFKFTCCYTPIGKTC